MFRVAARRPAAVASSSLRPRGPVAQFSSSWSGDDDDDIFGRLPPTPNERFDAHGRRLVLPSDVRKLNESWPSSALSPARKLERTPASRPVLGRMLSDNSSSSSWVPPPGSAAEIPSKFLTPTKSTDPKLTSDDLFGARSGVYDVLLKNRKVRTPRLREADSRARE